VLFRGFQNREGHDCQESKDYNFFAVKSINPNSSE